LTLLYHHLKNNNIKSDNFKSSGGRRDRNCMVDEYTTTYAIGG